MSVQTKIIKHKKFSLACSFTILQFFAVLPGHADPVDLKPYISLDATSDSNLFRVSDDSAAALGITDLSDDYLKGALGAALLWQYQRQKFDIDAQVNSNKYNQHDELDYTGGYLHARWDWVRGKLWNGKASYQYNRALKSFENSLIPKRDIKTDNRFVIEADRKIDERWFIRLGGQYKDIVFSDSTRNDKQELSLIAGAFYKTHAENTAGVELRVLDASFPNRDVNITRLIDDGYIRSSLDAVALWTFTGKSQLKARLGYTRQDQNNISVNDFDGMTGRFTHLWTISSKTKIESSIWRVLSTLSDEIANYAVVSGVRVEANWGVANKTRINAGVNFEQRDFKEDLTSVGDVAFESRKDDVYDYWLGLVYDPIHNLSLELIYNNGKRDSNRILRDYDYNSITANLKFTFN